MIPSDEESCTSRRLSQYEGCEQRQDNSQIRVVFRHGSPGHIPKQEGASLENRDPGGGDTSIVGRTSLIKRES